MEPVLAQALAALITTVSAVLMMWASHRWGGHDDK